MTVKRREATVRVVLGPYDSIHDARSVVLEVRDDGCRHERPWHRDVMLEPEYVEPLLNYMEIPAGQGRAALRSYCLSEVRETQDMNGDHSSGLKVGQMIPMAWAFYEGFRVGQRHPTPCTCLDPRDAA